MCVILRYPVLHGSWTHLPLVATLALTLARFFYRALDPVIPSFINFHRRRSSITSVKVCLLTRERYGRLFFNVRRNNNWKCAKGERPEPQTRTLESWREISWSAGGRYNANPNSEIMHFVISIGVILTVVFISFSAFGVEYLKIQKCRQSWQITRGNHPIIIGQAIQNWNGIDCTRV